MRKIKRSIAVILAAILAAGSVTACSTGKKSPNGQKDPGSQTTQATQEGTSTGEPAAMGRYREEEIAMPEEIRNHRYCTSFRGKDNQLELYTGEVMEGGALGEIFRFIYDGTVWAKDEAWWGTPLLEQLQLEFDKVAYGMDGRYYLSGMDENYRFHLYQISEDGTAKELLNEVFKPEKDRDYGLIPRRIVVLSKGNILVYGYSETSLYQPDGVKLYTMSQDFNGNVDDKNMYVNGNDFVTILDGAVVRYSLLDGQIKETIPYDGLQSGVNGVSAILFPDDANGIYAVNENGLAHVNQGGTVWENLIDGSLYTMGMRSIDIKQFFEGDQNDYYGIYTDPNGTGIRMYHYAYDPNMAAVPPDILTVYALHDNSNVRQAAALLQKDNPDVRVDFRVALPEGDDSMTEEVIRSLNTELLSGKGADVLILDGLPADSYIEKGILMDMREVFSKIQKESPLSGNILEHFTGEDGSIYEMPARVAFPVVFGESSVIPAFSSLESMASYSGDLPLVGKETYETLLRMMAHIQYQELFGNGLEGVSEELLQTYLEAVKTVGDSSQAKVTFTEEEMELSMTSNGSSKQGISGHAMGYDRGWNAGGLEYFDSIFGAMIALAILDKHPGTELKTVNGVYFPSSVVGINQATKQKEVAEQFVARLFSTPVQEVNFYDGFPVQMEAMEVMEAEESNISFGVGSGDGSYNIGAGWPSREKRESVLGMIASLTTPVVIDETVMEMIISESRGYFEGKMDAAQAASAISQKIRLYLAE